MIPAKKCIWSMLKVAGSLMITFQIAFSQSPHQLFSTSVALEKAEKFSESAAAFRLAANAYIQVSKYDSAIISFARSGRGYSAISAVDEARVMTDSARLIWDQGEKTNLDAYFEVINQQAKLELDAGKPALARPFMKEAVGVFGRSDSVSTLRRASVLSQLGASFGDAGLLDSAFYFYAKSLEIREQYELDPKVLGKAHMNLGSIAGKMGDFDTRYDHYSQSLALYRKEDSVSLRNEILFVYNNLGGHFMEKGDYETALPYFQHALTITRDLFGDNHPTTANIINNIGNYHSRRREYDKAMEYFEKAVAVLQNSIGPKHPFTAMSTHNLGFSSFYSGQKERGLKLVNEAIGVLEERFGPSFPPLLSMYENRGKFWIEKDRDKGIAMLRENSRSRIKALGKHHPRLALGLHLLARTELEAEMLDSAAISVQQGLIAASKTFDSMDFAENPDLEDASSMSHMMRLLHTKANICMSKQQYDLAQRTYNLAVEALNEVRNQFYQPSGKANLQEEALALMTDAANCHFILWQQGDDNEDLNALFSVVQQGKAALLTDHLRNDRALRFGGVPEALLAREQKLQADLVFYQTKMAEERAKGAKQDSARVERWLERALLIEADQRALTRQLESQFPQYFQLKYNVETPGIEEIQKKLLSHNQAILELFVANEALFVFWIKKDKVLVQKLQAEHVEKRAKSLHESLKSPNGKFETDAHALYTLLCEPFLQDQNMPEKLTVVPDGLLGYIPFEVLLTAVPQQDDLRSYPYLGTQTQIAYSYAIRLLFEKKPKVRTQSFAGFAPSYPAFVVEEAKDDALAGLVRDGLWELPGAKQEVERISTLLDGDAFIGTQATRDVFEKAAPDYGVLHLAMHALVNDKDPLQSYLIFTGEEDSLARNLLYASELYGMDLPAQLAVLSACNTGYGSLQRGEGIMSLSRAFAYAGCPSTVMSLWQAPDAETAMLMENFYLKLKEGNLKSAALSFAKKNYLESAYSAGQGHPFYWAGFILSGDNSPVKQGSGGALWPWLLVLGIAGLVSWAIYKKRP